MESWVVLGLGIAYLWNRARKVKENLMSNPGDQDLKEAQRPSGQNDDSLYTGDVPPSEMARLEGLRAQRQEQIQEFNGGVGEITGEYLPVLNYS